MKNMTSMMSSAGQMKEQKKLIDMHTKLAFALLKEIKARCARRPHAGKPRALTRRGRVRSEVDPTGAGKGGFLLSVRISAWFLLSSASD